MSSGTAPPRTGRPAPSRLPGRQVFRQLWARVDPYLGGNRRRVVLFAITALLGALGEATLLYVIVQAATAIAAAGDRVSISVGPLQGVQVQLGQLFAASFVLIGALVGLAIANAVLAARMSMVALANARARTFDSFIHARWDLQSREREGRLQELVTTYAKKIAQGVMVLTQGVSAAVSFAAFLVSAVVVSPVAAVTIAVGVLFLYAVLRPVTRLTRTRSLEHLAANSNYAVDVSQAASLAREIRAFDVTGPVRTGITESSEKVARLEFSTRLLGQLTPNLYQQAALLLILAGMLSVWLSGVGDVANLGAVVLLLVRALTYSQQLQAAIQQANEAAPYADVLEQHRRQYDAEREVWGSVTLEEVESIRFSEVGFAYEEGRPVLAGLTFEVREGETIGIVGPSGSGKSTLAQILLRLRAPTTGTYAVGDRSSADFTSESWCHQVVFVPQDNHLLHASVAENIRFFRDVDDEAVERAARLAHLGAEIEALPDGYDTIIGSGARDLSGGQRQRLGLARAIAGDPSVLVLDEPTSALDMRSEELIQQTLAELHGRLTLVIVAHRMTTLNRCDRIMVLDHGRIEAFADPASVAHANAFFRDATQLSRLPS